MASIGLASAAMACRPAAESAEACRKSRRFIGWPSRVILSFGAATVPVRHQYGRVRPALVGVVDVAVVADVVDVLHHALKRPRHEALDQPRVGAVLQHPLVSDAVDLLACLDDPQQPVAVPVPARLAAALLPGA